MAKRIVGRTEIIDLPSIPWNQVPCRIDTGAFRSSMHCDDIHLKPSSSLFKGKTAIVKSIFTRFLKRP